MRCSVRTPYAFTAKLVSAHHGGTIASTEAGGNAMLLCAITIVLVGLTISFFCSLLEGCVLSLSRAEVLAMGRETRSGRIWAGFKREVQMPLATILIVNTSAQVIATSFAAAKFGTAYGSRAVIGFSVVVSFLIIQWGEVLPKTLGARHRRRIAVLFSVPLKVCVVALSPLAHFVRFLNRPFEGSKEPPPTVDEISALAHHARSWRVIEGHQDHIIGHAARLGHVSARKIMVPREEMSILSSDMGLEAAFIHAHLDAHTRYPLCEGGDIDRVLGYVNLKELVAILHTNPAAVTLRGIARPIGYIKPDDNGSEVLHEFVDEHVHLAVVRGEGNTTLGMLTMEDLVEEIVGDLEDEFDPLPKMIHDLGGSVLMIGGGVDVQAALAKAGVTAPRAHGTVASWMTKELGHRPKPGEGVDMGAARLVVRRIRRGRVFEAMLTRP
jgi:CBS domain containing-hemolysin-like protein